MKPILPLAVFLLASAAFAADAPAPAEPAAAAEEAPAEASKPAPKKPAAPKDFTILKLNGEEIRNSEAEELWKNLFAGAQVPDFNGFDEKVRQRLLSSIVAERLIYQEAVKEGYNKSEEVKKRLANLERQVVLQSFMEQKAKKLVTDQQLKDTYAKKIGTLKNQEEVKARHILVSSEEEAKEIYKRLKKGEDFEKLAKEKSKDPGSAPKGGDLDYFTKDRMVPEFANAAFALKKGDVSEPVKTQFGWHVIKVEDKRKVRIPSFDELKEELTGEASGTAMQNYIESLLKKAEIKYYNAEGREKDFPRTLETR